MHIRVVTPVVPTGLTRASDFEGIQGDGDRLSYVEIETGPESIECEFDAMLAAPETVARIIEAESEGVDAVVIDCMGDPALGPARECVQIPVLGPCESTMNLACMLGHRFSILAVSERMRSQFENQARLYGAHASYASTRAIGIPVLDLNRDRGKVKELLLEQAIMAIESDRADTLIIGCTAMVGMAQAIQEELAIRGHSLPVLDPIPVTVRLARVLAESGLSQSKIAYPAPARKGIRGYDHFGQLPRKK